MYRIYDKVKQKYREDLIVNQNKKVCSPIAIKTMYKNGGSSLEVKNSPLLSQGKYIIELSTGIKDINGVELYENDICIPKRDYPFNKENYRVVRINENKEWRIGNNTMWAVAYEFIKIGTIHDKENKDV